jgi:XTP/dITP diphosphohydrolase
MKSVPTRILIATANQGKVREIWDLVRDLPIEFLSLADIENPPDVIEDQDTFEGNALKKARELAKATGMVSLADDSGLCVDALDGRPGVLSARYAGEGKTDEEKCLYLLAEMERVPDDQRTARFVCVIALVTPSGGENLFFGTCEGRITRELHGTAGFGYDPIFFYEPANCTFAEMDRQAKNEVSHRGRALREVAGFLGQLAEKDECERGKTFL